MAINLINTIFGMKIRQARTETGLNLSEFASQCDLSPSYVTEIEKGRKYPRADKIMRMADVLGKEYDDLVSIKLAPSLAYLESTLSSALMRRFPFSEFGLQVGDLVELLTREPEKASALLHAILDIVRRYDLKEEDFLRAALRSYQEIHENYFPDLEDAALAFSNKFSQKYGFSLDEPMDQATLAKILQKEYKYEINYEVLTENEALTGYRSVYLPGSKPKLLVNGRLYSRQVKFVMARELGYQYLKLKERSHTSTPDKINSFEQLLNDFKAAYFGGALLIPRQAIIDDVQHFFDQTQWNADLLQNMLSKYDVTPEMLFYRFSELIPQFFGVKLHFLRFHQVGERYLLIKQLNMNHLLVPSGIGLHEHYCRRWLSVKIFQDAEPSAGPRKFDNLPPPQIQLSEFLDSGDQFMAMTFVRSLVLSSDVASSVTVGFRVEPDLKHTIRFLDDPDIPHLIINETCERCPLTAVQCKVRVVEPVILQANQEQVARKLALSQLK